MKKWFFLLVPLALASLVCSLGRSLPTPTPDLSAIVRATLEAIAAQTAVVPPATQPAAPLPTATGAIPPNRDFIPPMGGISGHLSYPSEGVPPLRLVAINLANGEVNSTDLPAGASTYFFELPVGTYHVIAYSLPGDGFPGGLAGGYTRAVPCGLAVECADHNLIPVVVTEAQTTENVDPADWYAPEGTFPPMPNP